jgi:hypothetical protein
MLSQASAAHRARTLVYDHLERETDQIFSRASCELDHALMILQGSQSFEAPLGFDREGEAR